MKTIKIVLLMIISILTFNAHAQSGTQRYHILPNKIEVFDLKTGLIWQRCVHGYYWNGIANCVRDFAINPELKYAEAVNYAQTANQSDYDPKSKWRIPNAKEMLSLFDIGFSKKGATQMLMAPIFYDNPQKEYWTSTPMYEMLPYNESSPTGHNLHGIGFLVGVNFQFDFNPNAFWIQSQHVRPVFPASNIDPNSGEDLSQRLHVKLVRNASAKLYFQLGLDKFEKK